ncbi:MAG TPA: F0F1 ATP synthase subunit delta [Jiangellaceae bacterium]|nr:F0F1 ATP synthase subunit delta [Jiangellaceae bacterium]
MRATSQASLDAAGERWEPVLTEAGSGAFALGRELFDVVEVLDSSVQLRRALTDPSRDGEHKAGLASDLFGSKVSGSVLDLLSGIARDRWSDGDDLADALAALAIDSVLAAAQAEDNLEQVEEEVFRVSRVLADNRELRLALADSTRSVTDRQTLLTSVFGDQVSPQTGELLQRSLGSARYTSLAAALHTINEMGAKRRRRLVAVVTAATPLTEAQVRRLGEILTRSYGRKVQINVAVDPQVVGGMKIQIGDDVVDATTLGRLDEARRRLAG